uniref:Uncharacterized protein n=1 Tax=Marseillevirus sp. TaxID=2809551 RepID=A0AA96ESX5_9VIRU|nr:hypothetical protein MarDSR_493 [Marseillevirus sp.]
MHFLFVPKLFSYARLSNNFKLPQKYFLGLYQNIFKKSLAAAGNFVSLSSL